MSPILKIVAGLSSAVGGAVLVVAAFRYPCLNWIVDAPGWIASRFTPINFHEGEGARGFIIAVCLAWTCASLAVFCLGYGALQTFRRLKR